MALKDTWKDKINGVNDASAEDINNIANAVIENEEVILNKADRAEVANAVKCSVQGQELTIRDVSPLGSKLKVKLDGQYELNSTVYVITNNIWDEQWYYDEANTGIYSKNYIPVNPNTSYNLHCSSDVDETYENLFVQIIFYNGNGEEISQTTSANNTTITTPSNCYSMKFRLNRAYGRTYNDDIYINPLSDIEYEADSNGEFIVTDFNRSYVYMYPALQTQTITCEYNKDINAVIGDIETLLGDI